MPLLKVVLHTYTLLYPSFLPHPALLPGCFTSCHLSQISTLLLLASTLSLLSTQFAGLGVLDALCMLTRHQQAWTLLP